MTVGLSASFKKLVVLALVGAVLVPSAVEARGNVVDNDAQPKSFFKRLFQGLETSTSHHDHGGLRHAKKDANPELVAKTVHGGVSGGAARRLAPSPVGATAVQTFYIPFPEDQMKAALSSINDAVTPSSTIDNFISIAAVSDDTLIFYDHWEDGYEADITSATPSQNTTQIWGDGDLSNGAPPGVTSAADDVINAGSVIVLASTDIVTTTLQSVIDFDARDKFAVTKTVAVARAGWADPPDTVLAGALEVYDTFNWGTAFEVPVGDNLPTSGDNDANNMFQFTEAVIMAEKDGTVVTIDRDGPGGDAAFNVTLNEGESYFTGDPNGGTNLLDIESGGTITSTEKVQVDLITGDIGANYESRWFTLLPTDQWADDYYTPVGTDPGDATYVFVYNPNDSSITIQWETNAGTQTSFTLGAGQTLRRTVPDESGARFFSTDGNFYALSTIDSDSNSNLVHDWGFTLIPEDRLTSQILIGLGLGRDPTSTTSPNENSSPVWVTPVGADNVSICVDYNGDRNGTLTDDNGFKYDELLILDSLESERVYDPDGDQTGMVLYVCDDSGATLAAAWGQDPETASNSAPALDVGTGIPPLPDFNIGKSVALVVDSNGDGVISARDTLEFTIVVGSTKRVPVTGLNLIDTFSPLLTYVPNSTTQESFDSNGISVGAASITDAANGTFPLTAPGIALPSIPAKASVQVRYQAVINQEAAGQMVENTATVDGKSASTETPVPNTADVFGTVFEDTNGNGVQDSGEPGLPNVNVTITDSQGGTQTVTTDNNGDYSAAGVPAGNTTADVDESTLPPGYVQTAGIDPSTVFVDAGSNTDLGDDGYQPQGTVFGHIFEDTDGNGVQDTGEPDLAGVNVTITDSQGGTQTVTTDANGDYNATVPAGNTTADVDESTLPPGYVQTAGIDPSTVFVPAGSNTDIGDDGYQPQGTVFGHIFEDTDGNGVQDTGEPDLAGVNVTITDSQGGTQTVTTDANGDYDATVPAGNTTADVDESTLPPGYVQTAGIDPSTVFVPAGSNTDIGDDGYQPQGTVFGHIFEDTDGNGVQDSGEPDLAGVNVTITDSQGGTQTVTTDANGDYNATVPAGNTTADVDESTLPPGYVQTAGTDPTTVNAPAGIDTDIGDDGYQPQGTVFGNVFEDTDGDGVRDLGEPGLPNVNVTITDSQGGTQTVTTDANGDYNATVPAGNTTADVDESTVPDGYVYTTNDDPSTVFVPAGNNTDIGDDGYQPLTESPSSAPSSAPSKDPSSEPSQRPSGGPSESPSSAPSSDPSSSPSSLPSLDPSSPPTVTASASPSSSPSLEPSGSPSESPSSAPTVTGSASPSSSPSLEPSGSPSESPSSAPTVTGSASPSSSPSLEPSGSPSESPSSAPTVTASASPSSSPSLEPSGSPSESPSSAPTVTGSARPSSSPSLEPSGSPSESPSSAPTVTASASPSSSPSLEPSGSPSESPSSAPTVTASARPSSSPSLEPSGSPSESPSSAPTVTASARPSSSPSLEPSGSPSESPSSAPTVTGSARPSSSPSLEPSGSPSESPSSAPTVTASASPSSSPSLEPSGSPSESPSSAPTVTASASPSSSPSLEPSGSPSESPSSAPTVTASASPSSSPSLEPSGSPSESPSSAPTVTGSARPSSSPSLEPSGSPSESPSSAPTVTASARPSSSPSLEPSGSPSESPSSAPTVTGSARPSSSPSLEPSGSPSESPSSAPTVTGSASPSSSPSLEPSGSPSESPSSAPTVTGSARPSSSPSLEPSGSPSESPSSAPTVTGSARPSSSPSLEPSGSPSESPSSAPTVTGSARPSSSPSLEPSSSPSESPSSAPTVTASASPSSSPSLEPSSSPSESPSSAPTVTGSASPSSSPSLEPSGSPSESPSSAPTVTGSASPSSSPSLEPSGSPSESPSSAPTVTGSARPSSSPSLEPSGSPSESPSSAPTVTASARPSSSPSLEPSSSPSESPSSAPTVTGSASPSSSPSLEPSGSPSESPSSAPTVTGSASPSSSPSLEPSGSPSESPSSAPTVTGSASPSSSPSLEPSGSPSESPSSAPTVTGSARPSSSPSLEPSGSPSESPSSAPTVTGSASPSSSPSLEPSSSPSESPSSAPTVTGSASPSSSPSLEPSGSPSESPSSAPTVTGSASPSSSPSLEPSGSPSESPSSAPTVTGSARPSSSPSLEPSGSPSESPSSAPTVTGSARPSSSPSLEPSGSPSESPSSAPTVTASARPSSSPSQEPSGSPSESPSSAPTVTASARPSSSPSLEPSGSPSESPSSAPTVTASARPSSSPSLEPSGSPSESPSSAPTVTASARPSSSPSQEPSGSPSESPSSAPTVTASARPSSSPSLEPSGSPSESPSSAPTVTASARPSSSPSLEPSGSPSESPSSAPTVTASARPSSSPSLEPSGSPSESPSSAPTVTGSASPSSSPSLEPSGSPSESPSSAPTVTASARPSTSPSLEPSGSPSESPSSAPTVTGSASPSSSPSLEPSGSPSESPSSAPSSDPSSSPSSLPSLDPSSPPTVTGSASPSSSPSLEPSGSPSESPSSAPSSVPSSSPSSLPSLDPSSPPTVTGSASPSSSPSLEPSGSPSESPSSAPSSVPSSSPSSLPSLDPSSPPTVTGSASPSSSPSLEPSGSPSQSPSSAPSSVPSSSPSSLPSLDPSSPPTVRGSASPSSSPSLEPSGSPSESPSSAPSSFPSSSPSSLPSLDPSSPPTVKGSASPSSSPSLEPSGSPSESPSSAPSSDPSSSPSSLPSLDPSSPPTVTGSASPSSSPSLEPSGSPSESPSSAPSSDPSSSPSSLPSLDPSSPPTVTGSASPSSSPSLEPSGSPSESPSSAPSSDPSSSPSSLPSVDPSSEPSETPSETPSSLPSLEPSGSPSESPSSAPSSDPSSSPSVFGRVFEDTDGDGLQDAGEPGLSGVDVVITDSQGGTQTVTTDANGNYSATVPAGNTTADVDESTLPDGYVQTAGIDPSTVFVPAGSNTDIGDDGYQPQGTVFGHVFNDTNGNGVQDTGEPDLPNVNVVITDSQGGNQTVTTDANGNYNATVPAGFTTADVDESTIDFVHFNQTAGTDPSTVFVPAGSNTDLGDDGYQLLSPSITLVKTFANSTIASGSSGSFTLAVTNDGDLELFNVLVEDDVDPLLNVTSVTSNDGGSDDNLDGDSQMIEWFFLSLMVGETKTITVQFDVASSADVTNVTNVTNVGSVTADPPPPTADPNADPKQVSDNDEDLVEVEVPLEIIDLSIVKTFVSSKVPQGTHQSFTLVVSNAGPAKAVNVGVYDSVDVTLEVKNVKVTDGTGDCSASSGQEIDCIVQIPAGQSVTITVQYIAVPFLDVDNLGDGGGNEFYFIFKDLQGNTNILEGSTRDNNREVFLNRQDITNNGNILPSLKKNDITFDPPGDDPAFTLHLSCSDLFTNGWSDGEDGPVQGVDINWQIAYFGISRYNKNRHIKSCGKVVSEYVVPNTATASGVDSSGPKTASDTDSVEVTPGGMFSF